MGNDRKGKHVTDFNRQYIMQQKPLPDKTGFRQIFYIFSETFTVLSLILSKGKMIKNK